MYSLLTKNTKLLKSSRGTEAYESMGLALAPHSLSGHNVCFGSTKGCRNACVTWFGGRTVSRVYRAAALRRTALFFDNPAKFIEQLRHDIAQFARLCVRHGTRPCVRLNVASDLDWLYLADEFKDVRFYDYTKIRARVSSLAITPPNYTLTYSHNERTPLGFTEGLLARGVNVALVFDCRYNPQSKRFGLLPIWAQFPSGRAFPVIDGDIHDYRLRELDGRGVIVGLRCKGTIAARESARASGFSTPTGRPHGEWTSSLAQGMYTVDLAASRAVKAGA